MRLPQCEPCIMLLMNHLGDCLRSLGQRDILRSLEEAARIRLDHSACQIADGLMQSHRHRLISSAPSMFLPAEKTWVEMGEGQTAKGALIEAEDDGLQVGEAMLIQPAPDGVLLPTFVRFDLRSRSIVDQSRRMPNAIQKQIAQARGLDVDFSQQALNQIGTMMLAVLSLLCSPRMWTKREFAFDRLNRQRQARGKWPLLAYHEVTIRWDGLPPTVSEATGAGPERALHFCRAHLRVRLGRVEFVRPHWRGNARLGVKRPAYRLSA